MGIKTYVIIATASESVPDTVREKLDVAGLCAERIDEPVVYRDEIRISRSLADSLNRLLGMESLYIQQPGVNLFLHNGKFAEWTLRVESSRLTLLPYTKNEGLIYPLEAIAAIKERTFVHFVNSVVYYLSIKIIEDSEARELAQFYHFYERNRYVGSAFGERQAKALLEYRKDKWQEHHNYFWSDDGDIEKSLSPLAPRLNYSGDMDRWLQRYPDWKG